MLSVIIVICKHWVIDKWSGRSIEWMQILGIHQPNQWMEDQSTHRGPPHPSPGSAAPPRARFFVNSVHPFITLQFYLFFPCPPHPTHNCNWGIAFPFCEISISTRYLRTWNVKNSAQIFISNCSRQARIMYIFKANFFFLNFEHVVTLQFSVGVCCTETHLKMQ